MKIKTCGSCGKEGPLWKAKTKDRPGLCKTCAAKEKSSPKIGDEIDTGDFKGVVTRINKSSDRSIPELIQLAQIVFNKWIRNRDADNGYFKCISCSKIKPVDEMDAGHFFSVKYSAIRFDEDNCHGECKICNQLDTDHLVSYKTNLILKINPYRFGVLSSKKDVKVHWNREVLTDIIKKYKI